MPGSARDGQVRSQYRMHGAQRIRKLSRYIQLMAIRKVQMNTAAPIRYQAAKLPISVAGALMPDAHSGYGLPIGGVLACENAVIPYAVGVDIACRMKLSVLEGASTRSMCATIRRNAARPRSFTLNPA